MVANSQEQTMSDLIHINWKDDNDDEIYSNVKLILKSTFIKLNNEGVLSIDKTNINFNNNILDDLCRSFTIDMRRYESSHHSISGVHAYILASFLTKWCVSYIVIQSENYDIQQSALTKFILFGIGSILCQSNESETTISNIYSYIEDDNYILQEMLEYHIKYRINHEYSYYLFFSSLYVAINFK